MSAIFGIFHRDGSPVDPKALSNLLQNHRQWGPDGGAIGCGEKASACLGLGQARFFSTPEAPAEHLPFFDHARNLAFTAAGRVDNRDDLVAACRDSVNDWLLQSQQTILPDGDLMYLAYLCWGEEAPQHLYGDWAFAALPPAAPVVIHIQDTGQQSLPERIFSYHSPNHARHRR